MPERVIRTMAPEKYQPRAKAGMTRWCQSLNQNVTQVDGSPQISALRPLPSTGSQPSSTPKMMISTRPTKKPGMDKPNRASILPQLSHQVFTFNADSMPNGTPRAIEI